MCWEKRAACLRRGLQSDKRSVPCTVLWRLWLQGLGWEHWLHCLPHCLPPHPAQHCCLPLHKPTSALPWVLVSAWGGCRVQVGMGNGGEVNVHVGCRAEIQVFSCCLFLDSSLSSVRFYPWYFCYSKERCFCANLFQNTMKGRLCGYNIWKQCNVSTHTYSWTWRTQISHKTSPWMQQHSVEPCLGMLPLWGEPWVKPGDGDHSLQWCCLLCCLLGSSFCQVMRKRTK